MLTLDDFIAQEMNYFRPMLRRAKLFDDKQRAAWRQETIRERQERISEEVYDLFGGKVNYGPFKGLLLDKLRWWGKLDLGSQCLGLYEREFLNVIQDLKPQEFSVFIDVGAADGYYANGILMSRLISHCICFEMSNKGQQAIFDNWVRNGKIGKLDIYGEANSQTILAVHPKLFNNALVIIDVEGAEFDLLTNDVLSRLSTCTILLEIHNWINNFTERYTDLLHRVSVYFDIEILQNVERNTVSFPELRDFTEDNRLLLTSEQRPCIMRFLKLTPK